MRRPQFTLRALLVTMLVGGAFLAGSKLGHREASKELNDVAERLAADRVLLEARERQINIGLANATKARLQVEIGWQSLKNRLAEMSVELGAAKDTIADLEKRQERPRREYQAPLFRQQVGTTTSGATVTNSFLDVKVAIPNWDPNEQLRQQLFPTPAIVDDVGDRIDARIGAQLAEDCIGSP